MRGSTKRTLTFASLLFATALQGVAVAQNTNYNGPSLSDRIVSTQIGSKLYRFPRNYIISGFSGLRLGLDMSSKGGVSSDNIDKFERWGGGNSVTPSLVEAEITSGSLSYSLELHDQTLKSKKPVSQNYGLVGYYFAPGSIEYLPITSELTSIFCFDDVGNCRMNFDVSGDNSVLIRFSISRLPDWQAIKSFVKAVVETHGSDLR